MVGMVSNIIRPWQQPGPDYVLWYLPLGATRVAITPLSILCDRQGNSDKLLDKNLFIGYSDASLENRISKG